MTKKKRAILEEIVAVPIPTYDFEEGQSSTSSPSSIIIIDDTFQSAINAVEEILNYRFIDRSLIEAALTHSSFSESQSYQRLEFLGDGALGCAVANFVYITYPTLDPGQLSLLRAANISTEKLARVAVRHNLFHYVRHNAPALQLKVDEFALEIEREGDEILPFGGSVKAPKVLADIVESVAAAIFVDAKYDLRVMWHYFRALLEPLVTLENIQQQPVTMLYELCQKHGNKLEFQHLKKGAKNITKVYVDGKFLASASSEQKETSKLIASKEALQEMHRALSMPMEVLSCSDEANEEFEEIREAKQKLIEFCQKNGFRKPAYSVEKQEGPSHDRKYVCQVQIEIAGTIHVMSGDLKSKVKEAENSAASMMLHVYKNDAQYAITFP
ncbi:hypothetical protein ACHQM5_002783 [Ranunculus cassubicifolius]